MTLQQQITRTQVRCKLDDARRRAEAALHEACNARTDEEYASAVERGYKAGYDYSVWYAVLASIA